MADKKELLKDCTDEEKKAIEACIAAYLESEGADWHLSGINDKEKTDDGYKLSLMFCKGDSCSMQDMIATKEDGKYVGKMDEGDDDGFF
eukprot:CAMPEP_0197515602 /NCGR_PEP_ID=MMETSP1318-20131121/685_1 /TAXON_ID=552666 /ORGANISM="Partenskyella glossopodia, Strain RCC365" /LENGTH=88 /DNA_ID=CAMNT_0043064021 /DNA_START=30 /DNA_END=296 /DNA_ORIENTATION=+